MFYDPRKNNHNLAHRPFNALVVPRPIGWITTLTTDGIVNLAPFSFYNCVASSTPTVMFSSDIENDTPSNALQTGEFVVNLTTESLKEEMNASSARFERCISEPERVGIKMAPSLNVKPPRVLGSPVSLECRTTQSLDLVDAEGKPIPSKVVLGQVVGIHIDDSLIIDGKVDITRAGVLYRLGYMDYGVLSKDTFTMQSLR